MSKVFFTLALIIKCNSIITTVINISAPSKSVTVNWTFANVITMPIKYINRNNALVILYSYTPGVTISGNTVTYTDNFTGISLDDIIPGAGVNGYSTVVDRTTTSTNIVYSGNMQADFDAVDFNIEYVNNKIEYIPGTEWYVENTVKISEEKWDVIKHYISIGVLTTITIVYKISPDDTITIPVSSAMLSMADFTYTRGYNDAALVQPTTNETQINVFKYRYDVYPKQILLT